MSTFRPHVIAAAASLALSGAASAASCTFDTSSGNWNAIANWLACATGNGNPAGSPGSNDTAIIGSGQTVTVNTAQAAQALQNAGQVNLDAFTLTLGGGSSTNSGVINVGGAVTAALQFSGGGLDNTGGVINIANGSVLNQFSGTLGGGTINTTGTGKLVAFNNGSNFLSDITLNGALDQTATSQMRVSNGLTLNGSVSIGQGSVFAPQGDQTFSGNGSIVFTDNSGTNRFNTEAGNLTLGSGILVHGDTGIIGGQNYLGGLATLTNNGTIRADVSGGTIDLRVNGGVINNGTLGAANGGTLVLNTAITNNAGSQITATSGGTVVQNGVSLNGVINVAAGAISVANSGANFLNGVNFTGVLDLTNTSQERVTSGLTLSNGSVVKIGNGSVFAPQGDQTIAPASGTAEILFTDTSATNRFNTEAGALTLGAGMLVHGNTGIIGGQNYLGGLATLTNNGTILADVSGGTIDLRVNGGVTNNGTLGAANGGTLILNTAITNNAGSQITATSGGTVVQNGVTLNGVINVASGAISVANSGNNFLNGVNFTGVLDLSNTSQERVINGLTLSNGSVIKIGNGSVFAPQGDQTIAPASGTAEILFADASASNRFNTEAGTLTLGTGMLVHGNTGIIGGQNYVGGTALLINDGTISADVNGGTIDLRVNGGVTNHGTLSAANGGTLVLNTSINSTAGAQILAGTGSSVIQNGVTLTGVINVTGGGSFRAASSGNNFLDGTTFNGVLDLASNTSQERVVNGLVLNGTINIGANSVFAPQGNQSITGNGSIVFADAAGVNRFNTEAGTLTLGSGVLVRGDTGTIGGQNYIGGAATLVNNGTIQADVSGGTIGVTVNNGVTNNNLMQALNGGTLRLSTGVTQIGAGRLNAGAGSTVVQAGVTISGGSFTSSGSGQMQATNSGSNFLDTFTLGGTLAVPTAIERVVNGLTFSGGTINVASGVLAPQGNQTFGGTGVINITDIGPGPGRLNVEAGNLVLGSGITVQGNGAVIGGQAFVGGAASLTNNGTIVSNGTGGIILGVNGSVINNGLLQVTQGSFSVQNNLTGSGTLQVDQGSMTLVNGGHTQGTLTMGAAGASINIGTGNLTLNTDYTNAQWGSGNTFNRRAAVVGSGLVVAGGDVSQVISGANVTGGNTANATLTIGNLRVGDNTFNYQVANAGTTGPTLRGAIQTAVNGGNITDARLSGSGVTAANYSAGAPGGNSGNLAVTFHAASAGALAPLTGQVINLQSNFENIADQKLNIVLGSGAAAYNAAVGSTAPNPVQVANQRIGGSNTSALTVSNTASPGAFSEDLRASVGSASGQASSNGATTPSIIAGASNNSALLVGVNTATAGAKTGTVQVAYTTMGTVNGVSNGLGTAGANAPQTITVNGNVYQTAAGSILTAPLNFGTVQVGQSVSQNLALRNTASGPNGFVEDLNAGFGSATDARILGSGSLSGILAGQSSGAGNGTMTVSVNTANAGTVNGSIRVNFESAGAVGGVSNGLGTLALGGSDYAVSGVIQTQANVINQASPLINNPSIDLGAVRVGAATPSAFVSVTNQATVAPQAALNASISSGGAPITAAGSFNLLAPGATNAGSLQVGLNTATAGNYTGANAGSAVLAFVSDASNVGNCAPNCQLDLGTQTVSVSGKVYNPAVGQLTSGNIDFGVVRVGDTVSARNITVSNVATATALDDTLRVNLSGLSGPVAAPAFVAGVGAGGSTNFAVSLNTASAGVVSQNATLAFLSHNPDMADASAGADEQVSVSATINNLANADFNLLAGLGALTQSGTHYTLDLGNVALGSMLDALLQLDNDVSGPADVLSGQFDLSAVDDFQLSGWNAVAGLAAGGHVDSLMLDFLASHLGLNEDTVVFNGLGTNASDTQGLAQTRTLTIRANVFDPNGNPVPEPGSALLLLAAAFALRATRRAVR